MNLQATELRIGNYVSVFGMPTCVTIDILVALYRANKRPGRVIDLSPIEITAKLLRLSGFKAWDEYGDCGHIKDGIKLEYMMFGDESLNGWYFIADGMKDHVKIAYFHQLQNLYFALTGKELELNIEKSSQK